MRSLLSVSGVALAALPLFASAQDFVAEAPAFIALTAYHTGEPVLRTLSNGSTEEVAPRQLFRVGIRELLQHFVDTEVIPSITGWRIIAVWGDWAEGGTGYRFYLQNSRIRSELHPIPEEILLFETVDSATARKHTLSGDAIIGGSETYTSYARLKVALSSGTGTANGLATSMDIYLRPPGYATAVYLPGPTKFSGTGIWESADPDIPDSVLDGRFYVGGSRIVPAAPYAADLATTTTTGSTMASGLIKAGGATMNLGGSTLYTDASSVSGRGGVTLTGGTLATGTLNLAAISTGGTTSAFTLSSDATLSGSSVSLAVVQTANISTGVTLQNNAFTVLTGTPLLFESGTIITLDLSALSLSALSSGYVITDGVLTTVP